MTVFFDAFPVELHTSVQEVIKVIPPQTYGHVILGVTEDSTAYLLRGNVIKVPYRMYFADVDKTATAGLTDVQKAILHCIYTRSCDGYIREEHLDALLRHDFDYWAIPFIVKLCDEYVIEILEAIYTRLKDRDNGDIKGFCSENRAAVEKGYARMVSYWNEYYRERVFDKYVGKRLFTECFGYN